MAELEKGRTRAMLDDLSISLLDIAFVRLKVLMKITPGWVLIGAVINVLVGFCFVAW